MGRLFWKCFVAFMLAIMAGMACVALTLTLVRWTPNSLQKAQMDGADLLLRSFASVLEQHGVAPLDTMVTTWNQHAGALKPGLLVVDAQGRDRYGQTTSTAEIQALRQQLAQGSSPFARLARTPQGETWLLFMRERNLYDLLRSTALADHPPPIIPLGTGIVISLLFSTLLAGYLTRPIRNLRDALRELGAGKLATRVPPNMLQRQDEIADLGRDFNRMAGQIQALMGAQQRLLHDVSHELRSPLARMQAAVGLVRQADAVAAPMLERIERETERLDTLVGELLTLARLESGTSLVQRERVDVMDILLTIVDDARFEAQTRQCRVDISHDAHFMAEVSVELICRALENVIRNAVKFTAPGSTVEIRAHCDPQDQGLLVEVADRGPGVAAEELAQIFQPFQRSLNSAGVPGVGLGLTIAWRALECHGGSIEAQNREGGGLLLRLRLPGSEQYFKQ